jgi:AraC-like DNA-binding protein
LRLLLRGGRTDYADSQLMAHLCFGRFAAGGLGGLTTAGATALAQLSTIHRRQDEDTIRNDHENGVVAVRRETRGRQDNCEPVAQRASTLGDVDLHYDRDRLVTIGAILNMVGGSVTDHSVHEHSVTTASGVVSRASHHLPNPRSQEIFVAALSLAVNDALLGSPRRLERLLPSDPTIERLLQARGAANEMAREPAQLYLQCLHSAILTWAVARNALKLPARQRLAPLPKWRFARVTEYIDLHIEEPIRLEDLAKAAGLSRMHFAAQFRAYMEISPCKFVMMQRMRHAQVLLSDPRNTIVDVALRVGFRAQAHFTTMFHRLVGNTPHRWRSAVLRRTSGGVEPAMQGPGSCQNLPREDHNHGS